MSEDRKGLPVPGYQAQSQNNVDLVARNKKLEEAVLRVTDELKAIAETDKRWLAIGVTQLEQAFMAINRSIFKPSRIQGDLNA